MEGRGLPVGWAIATVGELTNVGPKNECADDMEVGFVPLQRLGVTYLSRHTHEPRLWKDVKKGYTQFQNGDVLLARITPSFENGKAGIARDLPNGLGAGSTEYIVFRPFADALDPRYLLAHFKTESFLTSGEMVMTGAVGQQRVPKVFVLESQLPLAPLSEQRRIADKLDTTLAAVEACRQRLDGVAVILKRFRQAVLAAATSGELTREWREENAKVTSGTTVSGSYLEPVPLPENYQRLRKKALVEAIPMWPDLHLPSTWSIQSIGDLYKANYIIDFADGNHGSLYPREADFADEGVRFLTASQVSDDGSIAFEDCPLLGFQKARQLGKGWSRTGDVILTHNATVGRCALVDEEVEPFLLGTSATFYRFNSDYIQPGYAWLLFSSPFFQDQLRACMEQTTRNQVPITKQTSLGFILPPILEQVEIWRRCEELFALTDCLGAKLTAARENVDRLTPALLAKAFRGELVSQDPSEEPASVLLERIRANRQVVSAGETILRRRSGRITSRTNSATSVEMLSRNDVKPNHLSTILMECGPLSAEALWSASQLEIDDFYEQLRAEEAQGFLREKRGVAADSTRLLESAP